MYLVDPDTGKLVYLKDAAIMGKLSERDDGHKVNREFDAPKTQVMGIIINGVLAHKLNWTMVAIGAMIAVMLELCGVSALAFAVGLYVPIQNSVPIFVGGICRWIIDSHLARKAASEAGDVANDPEARARAEIEAIRKSETSPGVLLASGFIAGGSLAGVAAAFLEFSKSVKDNFNMAPYLKGTFLQENQDSATWTVMALFAGLAALLLVTGTGMLFRPAPENGAVDAAIDGPPIRPPDT
jgi:hypothetical protein